LVADDLMINCLCFIATSMKKVRLGEKRKFANERPWRGEGYFLIW